MQVAAINRRAQQKYAAFVSAMDQVLEAFDALDVLIGKVDDKHTPGGWRAATQDELKGFRLQAFAELERLRTITKKYEAELLSRDWRI